MVHELRNMPYIHPSNSRSDRIRGRSIHRRTHEARRSRNTLGRSALSCNPNHILDRGGRILDRGGRIQGRGRSRSRRDRGRILNRGQVTTAKHTDSLYQFVAGKYRKQESDVEVIGACWLVHVQFVAVVRRNVVEMQSCKACFMWRRCATLQRHINLDYFSLDQARLRKLGGVFGAETSQQLHTQLTN